MDEPREDMTPGDEAPPEEASAGEDICERCGGEGTVDGGECPDCGGTGKVVAAIGGG